MESFSTEFELNDRKFRNLAESDDPNLDKVRDTGAKIIHYHGTADPNDRSIRLLELCQQCVRSIWCRQGAHIMRTFYYPVDGALQRRRRRCAAGKSPRTAEDLGEMVEKGVAPDYIVAHSTGNTRSRKICSYPDVAVYKGTGSTDDEDSFRCEHHSQEPARFRADSITAKRYHEAP